MRFGPRIAEREKEHALPEGVTEAELALMQVPWFHGSSRKGIKTLRPADALRKLATGRPPFFFKEVIYITPQPLTSETYGKHISEWKLLRPLMIVENGSGKKYADAVHEAKERGYAGVYFEGAEGRTHPYGALFHGRDLEKIGEKTRKQREEERIEALRADMREKAEKDGLI